MVTDLSTALGFYSSACGRFCSDWADVESIDADLVGDGNGWVQPLVDRDGFVHGGDRRRRLLAWPRFEYAAGELISDGRLLSIV
ncbi:hypothetical protein ACLOJK_035120 [Asimina triloba]